jgi:hypothetical protein
MQPQHDNSFDDVFGAWLKKSANPISRRSLLGRGIHLLLGGASLVAIGIVADVPGWGRRANAAGKAPATDPDNDGDVDFDYAPPEGFDPTCSNLHGVTCAGDCDLEAVDGNGDHVYTGCELSNAAEKQYAWVGCCKDTETEEWACYAMADVVCDSRPTNWWEGCPGPGTAPAGRVWFGGNQGNKVYVCTVPTLHGEYSTMKDCAKHCDTKLVPNTWKC